MPEEYDAFGLGYVEEVIDFGSTFRDEEEVTSPEYPAEGLYHIVVQTADSSGKAFAGAVFLTLEILGGNVDNQEGKNLRWVVWPVKADAKNPASSKKRWQKDVLRLMLALGLRKPGEFPKVVFNDEWWQSLEGKQCIVKVTHKENSRKSESGKVQKWTSAEIMGRDDFFAIGDEAVTGVAINEEAARLGGYLESAEDI